MVLSFRFIFYFTQNKYVETIFYSGPAACSSACYMGATPGGHVLAYSACRRYHFKFEQRCHFSENNLTFDNKVKAGMMAGVEAEYQVSSCVALSLGAFYAEQGCKYDSGVTGSDNATGSVQPGTEREGFTNMESNLKYINVPLMLNLYVAEIWL